MNWSHADTAEFVEPRVHYKVPTCNSTMNGINSAAQEQKWGKNKYSSGQAGGTGLYDDSGLPEVHAGVRLISESVSDYFWEPQ